MVVTPHTRRELRVSFNAMKPRIAKVTGAINATLCVKICWSRQTSVELEGVQISLDKWRQLTLITPKWHMTALSTYGHPMPHIVRLDVKVAPRYEVCNDPIKPHGLIGQTYDCDGLRIDGRSDTYKHLDDGTATQYVTGKHNASRWNPSDGNPTDGNLPSPGSESSANQGWLTTKAQGEGALEGSVADYAVAGPFVHAFRFSRFNKTGVAGPRLVSALSGKRRKARLRRKLTGCTGN